MNPHEGVSLVLILFRLLVLECLEVLYFFIFVFWGVCLF